MLSKFLEKIEFEISIGSCTDKHDLKMKYILSTYSSFRWMENFQQSKN